MRKLIPFGFLGMCLIFQACGAGGENPLQQNSERHLSPANLASNSTTDEETSSDPDAPEAAISATSPFSTNFVNGSGFAVDNLMPGGSISFGTANPGASDGLVAQLNFPGIPSAIFSDYVSPDFAEQIRTTRNLSFGKFTVRVKLSSCASTNEGLVYGIFTYWNGGVDLNKNGMIDNSEIDYEFLCAEPSIIYMTIWTDYTDDNHFMKVTRMLDLSTGLYYQTTPGQEKNSWLMNTSGYLKNAAGQAVSVPGFNAMNQWMTLQFVWSSTSVQYNLTLGSTTYNLWTYNNSAHIPSHAAPFMVNMWHNDYDWDTDQPADFPTTNETAWVDSFSYSQ